MYMQYSILAVLLLGSVLAQMMPYIRKVKEGKVKSFDFQYAKKTAIAALWSSLLTLPVYTSWEVPSGIVDVFIVHVMAFLFGFGGLELQKEGLKYYRMIKPAVEKEASA